MRGRSYPRARESPAKLRSPTAPVPATAGARAFKKGRAMDTRNFPYWFASAETPLYSLYEAVRSAGRKLREAIANPANYLTVEAGAPNLRGLGPKGDCFSYATAVAEVYGGEAVRVFLASMGDIEGCRVLQICGHCIYRSPAGTLHEVIGISQQFENVYVPNLYDTIPDETSYYLSPSAKELDRWRKLYTRTTRDIWERNYVLLLEPENK